MYALVDLHLHSTASDGLLTPEQVVRLALERGLRTIALTDHDSTGGVDAAQAAARASGLEVITGVELNTDVPSGEAHVLGYLVDHHDATFEAHLTQRRAARVERGEGMVRKLRALGLDISWDRVQEIAGVAQGGAVGRPHVAQALVEKGYIASVQEAFNRYIGRDGPAYVAWEKFEPERAVEMIKAAGGLPVLAHPPTFLEFEAALPRLIEAGLAGLECYYGQFPVDQVRQLVALAARHGLVATGGSDYHGTEGMTYSATLGGTHVPPEVVDALKARYAATRA